MWSRSLKEKNVRWALVHYIIIKTEIYSTTQLLLEWVLKGVLNWGKTTKHLDRNATMTTCDLTLEDWDGGGIKHDHWHQNICAASACLSVFPAASTLLHVCPSVTVKTPLYNSEEFHRTPSAAIGRGCRSVKHEIKELWFFYTVLLHSD